MKISILVLMYILYAASAASMLPTEISTPMIIGGCYLNAAFIVIVGGIGSTKGKIID